MKKLILSAITFFAIARAAHSYEFHTFVDQRCRIYSGLITNVDKESFSLWKLDGKITTLRRSDITAVLIFDSSTNPYTFQKSLAVLRPFLRKIVFGKGDNRESIIGWPYKFVEDLVFYISVENKNYVLSMGQVSSIEKLEPDVRIAPTRERPFPIKVNLAEYLPHCFSQKNSQDGGLRPTRAIIDKIKIFVFFENLEKGFNRINSFEDRTRVYARPFLYGKQVSRFGFLSDFGNKKEFNSYGFLPLYFERTKGVDFHFQSKTRVGASHQTWLPNVEPLFAVTSEIKSHFFNALFVGNLAGLRAGKEVILDPDDKTLAKDQYNVTITLNHLALMGFDYHKYSFSLGFYHPTYAISTEDSETHILAGSASPMARFQYIGKKSRFRILLSHTGYDGSSKNDVFFKRDRDIDGNDKFEDEQIELSFFEGYNVRIGFDYQFDSDFMASIDEVVSWGKYRETRSFVTGDNARTTELSEFDFRHLYTTAYLQKDMGDYVFVQLRGNYYKYKYGHDIVGTPKKLHEGDDFKMGVILGFIF